MHQEKEEAKPHRTKSSTKTKTKKKRRKVFMLSQSDDHEEHSTQQQTNDPPSRVASSSSDAKISTSHQPTKQQHPHHQPKPTQPKNDAVTNVRPPSPRPSGSSQLKLVIVNIQLMTILPVSSVAWNCDVYGELFGRMVTAHVYFCSRTSWSDWAKHSRNATLSQWI